MSKIAKLNKSERQPKEIYLLCCEGEGEQNLFDFLKLVVGTKNKIHQHKLLGFGDFTAFQKRYKALTGGLEGNPNYFKFRLINKSSFIFLFDNDLQDSQLISEFIIKQGHRVIQLDPNLEGFLLLINSQKIPENQKTELYRKQLKEKFNYRYGKEVQLLKKIDWEIFFGKDGYNIPELRKTFKTLDEMLKILEV
jgi:hypothetical protein